MKPKKFEGYNKIYNPPPTMTEEDCLPLPAMARNGHIVSCWEISDEEYAELGKTRELYIVVVGDGQPPIYPSSYNPVTDILSVGEEILRLPEDWAGSNNYLVLVHTKSQEMFRFAFVQLTNVDVFDVEFQELVVVLEAEVKETVYRGDAELYLLPLVKELQTNDIVKIFLTTDLPVAIGDFLKKSVLEMPNRYYLIAEAQGVFRTFSWKLISDKILDSNNPMAIKVEMTLLRHDLERKKKRNLAFEPIEFFVGKQIVDRPITTQEDLAACCEIRPLGEYVNV